MPVIKWIEPIVFQKVPETLFRRTSLSMNKPKTWCKSGRVSLVSSSCLYKTQPERALAQVCHTRIDALSPDEYQFHLLLHRNSHHSQATYPKWLNHYGRTDRWTDKHWGESSIPPFHLWWSGGIIKRKIQMYHTWVGSYNSIEIRWYCLITKHNNNHPLNNKAGIK